MIEMRGKRNSWLRVRKGSYDASIKSLMIWLGARMMLDVEGEACWTSNSDREERQGTADNITRAGIGTARVEGGWLAPGPAPRRPPLVLHQREQTQCHTEAL